MTDSELANKMVADYRAGGGTFEAGRIPRLPPSSGTDANIAALVAKGIALGRAKGIAIGKAEGIQMAADDLENALHGIVTAIRKLTDNVGDKAK